MALIIPLNGHKPILGNNCFIAANATLVGQLSMGNDCSIWFNTVIRADVNWIRIGNEVNIQDGAIVHCTYQIAPTTIGNRVSIGHNAIVHGCVIDDDVLIGMGAIVMDHAHVQSGAIIAAGAVVVQNTIVESGTIYAGTPARKIREMTGKDFSTNNQRIASNYLKYADWYRDSSDNQ